MTHALFVALFVDRCSGSSQQAALVKTRPLRSMGRVIGLAGVMLAAAAGITAIGASEALAAESDDVPKVLSATDGDGVVGVALIVGVNRSIDAQLPMLHYADDDAVRYDELFRTLGTRTHLLMRSDENTQRVAPAAGARARAPRRFEMTQALDEIAREVADARARGRRTVFYFIYAGHGSLSRGEAYLALEDARLTGVDIEHDIVDRVHADASHLIIDACYSYFLAYGRGPGGARREIHGFAPTEGLARRADVGLLLSTTSARESHEWEGFQAGVFSHEVRSGLFGAADFDGDGRVSYREIAAFVDRANAAIPNERFRPDVFARAPQQSTQLLDLRPVPGLRRLVVDGASQVGRYFLDDTRGVRLADFHNAAGHGVQLLLPANSGPLYLRRTGDDQEFEIPPTPDVITLSELTAREPRSTSRGAAHDAFSLIFSLPFDDAAFARATSAQVALAHPAPGVSATGIDAIPADEPSGPRPRWRTVAGFAGAGVAVASIAVAAGLTLSARSLAAEARSATSQQEAAALNSRLGARNDWARLGYAVGGAAAVTSAVMLLWPSSPISASAGVDAESAMLEVASRF